MLVSTPNLMFWSTMRRISQTTPCSLRIAATSSSIASVLDFSLPCFRVQLNRIARKGGMHFSTCHARFVVPFAINELYNKSMPVIQVALAVVLQGPVRLPGGDVVSFIGVFDDL